MIGFAESTFARQHPETGFTCSLTQLGDTAKSMGVDKQVSSGTYNGYRIGLSGCEGKPAGSYQIFVEPISAGAGNKTFCSDATQNVRVLDGGSGANCFAFGRVQSSSGDGGWVGFDIAAPEKSATDNHPK